MKCHVSTNNPLTSKRVSWWHTNNKNEHYLIIILRINLLHPSDGWAAHWPCMSIRSKLERRSNFFAIVLVAHFSCWLCCDCCFNKWISYFWRKKKVFLFPSLSITSFWYHLLVYTLIRLHERLIFKKTTRTNIALFWLTEKKGQGGRKRKNICTQVDFGIITYSQVGRQSCCQQLEVIEKLRVHICGSFVSSCVIFSVDWFLCKNQQK